MSAPQFTPGPWHYLDMGEVVPSDSDGLPDSDTRICFMATSGSAINAHERIEANANLIAAAPELAEALADLMSYHDVPGPVDAPLKPLLKAGLAALAKVRGES